MIIESIVAMDERGGIGKNNKLLCYLPADLAYFKSTTLGKTLIMGHSTYRSIGKPLPGRRSIVLTSQDITIAGVEVAHTLSQALALCDKTATVMIIGGASVYKQSMDLVTTIYVTKIHHVFDADTFFPPLDETKWSYSDIHLYPIDEKNRYSMTFGCFKRKQ